MIHISRGKRALLFLIFIFIISRPEIGNNFTIIYKFYRNGITLKIYINFVNRFWADSNNMIFNLKISNRKDFRFLYNNLNLKTFVSPFEASQRVVSFKFAYYAPIVKNHHYNHHWTALDFPIYSLKKFQSHTSSYFCL